jgi:hypothetical protein
MADIMTLARAAAELGWAVGLACLAWIFAGLMLGWAWSYTRGLFRGR